MATLQNGGIHGLMCYKGAVKGALHLTFSNSALLLRERMIPLTYFLTVPTELQV